MKIKKGSLIKIIKESIDKVLNEATWNYHYGKNHNGKPYISDNRYFMRSRNTGHFGSGTYFSTYNDKTYNNPNPKYGNKHPNQTPNFIEIDDNIYRVDIDLYKNLYRVYNKKQGDVLYTLLSVLNRMFNLIEWGSDTSNLSAYYQKVIRNSNALQLSCPSFRELVGMMKKHSKSDEIKSFSTYFMEYNGYNGVNVSGVDYYDNTLHGSVIYDLSKIEGDIEEKMPKNLSHSKGEYYDDIVVPNDNHDNDYELNALMDNNERSFIWHLNDIDEKRALRILKNYLSTGKVVSAYSLTSIGNENILSIYLKLVYNKVSKGYNEIVEEWFSYKNIEFLWDAVKKTNSYYWMNYIPQRGETLLLVAVKEYYYSLPWGDDNKDKIQQYVNFLKTKMNREFTEDELKKIEDYI